MRSIIAALMATVALTASAGGVAAQGIFPFTVEARGGLAFPTDEFDPGVEAGYLVEATAKYSPLPFVSVYAGWSFASFGAEDYGAFAGADMEVHDSGVRLVGELGVPLVWLLSGVAP